MICVCVCVCPRNVSVILQKKHRKWCILGFSITKSQRPMQLSCQKKTPTFLEINLFFVCVWFWLSWLACLWKVFFFWCGRETISTLEHMILMTRFCSLFFGHQTSNLSRHNHIYLDSPWIWNMKGYHIVFFV